MHVSEVKMATIKTSDGNVDGCNYIHLQLALPTQLEFDPAANDRPKAMLSVLMRSAVLGKVTSEWNRLLGDYVKKVPKRSISVREGLPPLSDAGSGKTEQSLYGDGEGTYLLEIRAELPLVFISDADSKFTPVDLLKRQLEPVYKFGADAATKLVDEYIDLAEFHSTAAV